MLPLITRPQGASGAAIAVIKKAQNIGLYYQFPIDQQLQLSLIFMNQTHESRNFLFRPDNQLISIDYFLNQKKSTSIISRFVI
jgi:antitoxin component YwqK of YwqJK toxin-antitoxin module